nr:ATP-binding cassette domain-containing protein [Salegentibacter sp. UBA1130]
METTLILSLFLILIVGLYLFINKKLSKRYEYLRKLNEEYYGYVDDSIKGFKELKISAIRRENFFTNHLGDNRKKAMKVDISLTKKYLILNLLSQNGIYLLLGLVFIILIYLHSLDSEQIITYVVALLFLNGPINGLISMQSFLIKAIVSNKRIKRFFSDFKQEKVCDWEKVKNYGFNNLKFDDIKFSYDSQDQFNFAIERLNLSIEKGEIIFITGGNGSGKSTFVNILTGLYSPNKGKILLNGEEINNLESSYKDLFAVIYSNNYIFSKNYNNYSFEGNNYYKELLKIMQMDDTVLDDREASIRRKFSKGQSKRMSLILALLEDKPILVLDEWAADQDPYFRKYFYEELIPMLKRRGKTIIAVTHDDAYFKQADRIIKFEYGTISESKLVSNIPT